MADGATKERVGIVGTGRMGLAMLKHLVRHGHQVTACDLDGDGSPELMISAYGRQWNS